MLITYYLHMTKHLLSKTYDKELLILLTTYYLLLTTCYLLLVSVNAPGEREWSTRCVCVSTGPAGQFESSGNLVSSKQ